MATAVLVALAAALAGCGAGGAGSAGTTASSVSESGADAATTVKSALTKSLEARSAAVVLGTTLDTADGRHLAYTMTGRMRLDGLEADMSGVLPAGMIPNVAADVPIRAITYHGTVYYHYDFPNGRSIWIKADAGAKAAGAAPAGGDTDAQLRALNALHDVSKVGSETVDGVDAVHYRGVVDDQGSSTLLENLGAGAGAAMNVPVDVWIDGRGRLVRESMTVSVQGTTVTVDMRFSDWGVAMSVEPPKDAIPIEDLQGGKS